MLENVVNITQKFVGKAQIYRICSLSDEENRADENIL